MVIFLNLVLAGLRLGLKNYQVGEKWIPDDYLYLCKGLQWSEYFYSNNKINLEIRVKKSFLILVTNFRIPLKVPEI
ncbi:hypothetical protein [Bathymodiolus thermophilus thioautotrophic gill symbiont]|uniref:hypothetical protein n=1 Tax=Bathymodiolus thermophilus thioautotrophic gill symbiont TaxID=2360 RepID=UPI001C593A61|nr:hypothetical protein [Bathymodiolus thermophilus thioautotrophic gill symbiont]